MSNPSPACTANSASPPVDVTGSSTVNIALANPAGAAYWFLSCVDADDTTSVATINSSIVINLTNKTATLTAPSGTGSAIILMSTVGISPGSALGQGLDANFQVQAAFTTTFKVNVPTVGGQHVLCVNETFEQNATYGWIVEINAAIRASSGSSYVPPGFIRKNANWTATHAQSGSIFLCDTSGGAWTFTLPTGSNANDADEFTLVDNTQSFATHALTVTTDVGTVPIVNPADIGNPGTITADSFSLSEKGGSVRFKYDKTVGQYLVI
jgi:hypothetical protein